VLYADKQARRASQMQSAKSDSTIETRELAERLRLLLPTLALCEPETDREQNSGFARPALTEIPHCHRFLAAALLCTPQTTPEVPHG
jgi:hypothetical protein